MDKADLLIQKIKGWVEELKNSLAEGHGGALVGWLEHSSKFHHYSTRNQLLIFLQRPDASLVAGLKRWGQMGRRVKKGEVKDEATSEVRVEERRVGFHHTYVFDISQTEGEPVVLGRELPQGPAVYQSLRAACPLPVQEEPLGVGHCGYTDGKKVVLSSALSYTARAETLLHEWAHTRLHFDGVKRPAEVEELEAEATAYAVGRGLGLEMKGSRDYILHWQGTVEDLERSLERISQTAREMLGALEGAQPAQAEAA